MQMARGRPGIEAVALIRGYRSLGKLSATPVLHRSVDTRSAAQLAAGLKGCDTVVNATLGDVASIRHETRVMVEACRLAGVARFIHMSSAVVYGRVKEPSLPENAPPQTRSWMLYAREKAMAELYLRQEMARGGLQIIVLRPGLIWGPGSTWDRITVAQLKAGMTLVNGGQGICNLIYVDNLVELILRAAGSAHERSGFYNARDLETVTWHDYTTTLVHELGWPAGSVRSVSGSPLKASPKRVLEWALQQRLLYRMMRLTLKQLSPEAKQALKTQVYALFGGGPQPPVDAPPATSGVSLVPRLDRQVWELQTTVHPLPAERFAEDFGAPPMVPFAEGARRTAAWLKLVTAGIESVESSRSALRTANAPMSTPGSSERLYSALE
jgi:2-alkyl-3-oxoalkanoate reductase